MVTLKAGLLAPGPVATRLLGIVTETMLSKTRGMVDLTDAHGIYRRGYEIFVQAAFGSPRANRSLLVILGSG